MGKSNSILILLIAITLSSCEKVFFEDDLESSSPEINFEYLWNECNEKYSYFDVKNIDWDVVKAKYAVKLYEGMSDDSLFSVMGAMMDELRDDHANLISNFNVSYFGVQFYGPDNFDWRIVEDNYIGHKYYSSGPFQHNFLKGTQNKIGYIRFSKFTGTVDDENLGFLLSRYKDTKGLILDLRENGGGAVRDLYAILSHFVDAETILFYSRIKNGSNRNDFTEPEKAIVFPAASVRYLNKVAVLIDRSSFSATSFTALASKALPQFILIGDTTGGGLGIPNGGQLPNGWTYRFSVSQALSLDLNPAYENGVPPDIFVRTDLSDRTKDDVIEKAIVELLN